MQPIDIGDESRSSRAAPAPMDARIGAAVVDSFAVALLTTLFIALPFLLSGLMTPTLALCGAVLIWTIAPLWLFRQTLGMRLFGVEMVSKTGHSADLAELLFRELVGRGYLPAIYLASLGAAVALRMMGFYAGVVAPTGFALIASFMALVFLALAVTGNLVAFIRADRRTLADLIAKTMVIPKRDLPEPEDEDDRQMAREERSRKIRNFVIFTVIVTLLASVAPFVVTWRPGPKDARAAQAKVNRQKLELSFSQDKTNARTAYDLAAALRWEGENEKAEKVLAEHGAAVKERDDKREAALKERIAANADDEDALDGLLGLYADQGRTEDAKAAYRGWVSGHDTASERGGFGIWLYQRNFNDEAITELETAVKMGSTSARTHAYLGWAYQDAERPADAKKLFKAALKIDPDMEEVRDALSELEGPVAPAGR